MQHLVGLVEELCLTAKVLMSKAASRKFIVFAIATHMAYYDILDSANWLMVAMLYMGAQAALDWRENKTQTTVLGSNS